MDVMTAVREANQVGTLQPTTLVAYEADIDNLFDCRKIVALAAFDMTPASVASATWRDEMRASGRSRTQIFADKLASAGFAGLIVRSFAKGSSDADLNAVLWKWSDTLPHQLIAVDDDGRLARI